MQIIATRYIWQQASLILTPPASSQLLSLLFKQIVGDNSDGNKSLKKGGWDPHPLEYRICNLQFTYKQTNKH